MNDNALISLARATLLAQMPARGLGAPWDVVRDYQPTQQGANSTPTVYVHKVTDKRYGSPSVGNVWDEATETLQQFNSQQMETTLQFTILLDESTDPEALTPSDAANIVCDIIGSDDALAAFRAQGVGVLRVGQVTNPADVNDRDQFAADPSIDVIFTHRREWQSTTPVAVVTDVNINRV